MNEQAVPPPTEDTDARIAALYDAYSEAMWHEAEAEREEANARQELSAAHERLATAKETTAGLARAWHRACGRQQRMARKGGR